MLLVLRLAPAALLPPLPSAGVIMRDFDRNNVQCG
jgi:hypothetical protein